MGRASKNATSKPCCERTRGDANGGTAPVPRHEMPLSSSPWPSFLCNFTQDSGIQFLSLLLCVLVELIRKHCGHYHEPCVISALKEKYRNMGGSQVLSAPRMRSIPRVSLG